MLLKKGSKGDDVQALQEALLALGYHPGPIDGKFGQLTEDALEKFQKAAKISVDGICGSSTFGELNKTLVAEGSEPLDLPEEQETEPEKSSTSMKWVACKADKVPNRGGFTAVTLRQDAAESYQSLRKEALSLGGVLTSAGGKRGLSSKAGPARSKTSMHYVGLALDLALPTGMQDPDTDPYLVEMEDDRYWRIWCKTNDPCVPEVTVKSAYAARIGGKSVIRFKTVTCRAFDLTSLFKKHGWERIRARKSFFTGGSYGGAEWWHFQYERALTPGKSTFGTELLKLYSQQQAEKFVYWTESKGKVFAKTWF